jgi:SAM-dependent methyltransferase
MSDKLRVLNVGGNNKNIPIPSYFANFEHLLLDIDPKGKPDIVCDARELPKLQPQQFDAIYCSHNLEHFFAHDVPKVLSGFRHVLKTGGFAEIRVPDLDLVMKTYVEKKMDLDSVLYHSGAGPIMVRDVLYGFGKEIERSGVDFYAHKTGFSQKTLSKALFASGFKYVLRRPGRAYELFLVGFLDRPAKFHEQLLGFKMPETAQVA